MNRTKQTYMNARHRRLRPRFLPETRFELNPVPAVPFRGTHETELERLKHKLLADLLASTPSGGLYPALRRAANEAAALAWVTPFPLLFFPQLLEEKAALARNQLERQESILRRSRKNLQQIAA